MNMSGPSAGLPSEVVSEGAGLGFGAAAAASPAAAGPASSVLCSGGVGGLAGGGPVSSGLGQGETGNAPPAPRYDEEKESANSLPPQAATEPPLQEVPVFPGLQQQHRLSV